jgi:hypothetical protein
LRRRRDLSPVVLPALAALAAAALLLWANLRARHGQIVTSDEGVWPGSWKRRYGWPWDVYGSFGYDPGSGGVYWWCLEGLALDLAVGLLIAAGAALLARMLAPSRP